MPAGAAGGGAGGAPYRIMLVDDSAVIRGLYTKVISAEPDIEIVASVGDGEMALRALERNDIEVAVLDIEMPRMDGLTALPKLLKINPNLQIIMSSTLTLKNADISLRAMQAGAKDYIPKPTTTGALVSAADFKRELVQKIKVLGAARRKVSGGKAPSVAQPARFSADRRPAAAAPVAKPAARIALRTDTNRQQPEAIAIGSSTGGPQALMKVLGNLRRDLPQPIFITQHMPATFTPILAEHLSRASGWDCREGKDGEVVTPNRIYLAPGNYHMVIEVEGGRKIIRLNQNPPENFCRPSVDPMLRSLAKAYGSRLLVLMLTGMGKDGQAGSEVAVQAGGTVAAQDEETSVVWGMPGAVATAGLCSAVLPLDRMSAYLYERALRSAA
ncbi:MULTISPECIES: protein-glutamate methylesterase/protein-glutamine glutaminase [Oceanibaculum]|uniref:Protein-glutamate methylesterase/protein-glutamine glutaminase n=1 Tax=Oceanibaculum indicum TaxID=526216 RepID=A0A420WS76_9PROT|nr:MULTISPECIES: chemotaxis response regulator protein-glutamate methylesterase [Oceanibaculum]MCH2395922.1 chemotaxis response regulator protein-glutamate methylesterase [Oceanibaculum sp.]RKQ73840.1 two-component system chemotaxis response regulator CheB [Oceanibaculum indicum]